MNIEQAQKILYGEVTNEQFHRAQSLPMPVLDKETRLKGAIIEACEYLRLGAPGRALETLESSLRQTRKTPLCET